MIYGGDVALLLQQRRCTPQCVAGGSQTSGPSSPHAVITPETSYTERECRRACAQTAQRVHSAHLDEVPTCLRECWEGQRARPFRSLLRREAPWGNQETVTISSRFNGETLR